MVVAFEPHANDAGDVADPAAASGFGHETTRYLCGAAYTDRVFREAVLGHSREAFRARAPEVGVDVGMVTAHCKRAQNSKMIRDLVICAPSAVFLFLMFKSLDSGALRDGDVGRAAVEVAGLCWLVAMAATLFEAFNLDGILRGKLTRDAFYRQTFEPDPQRDSGNLVVYSGFSPFAGSGSDLGGWSFAVDLERGKQGMTAHEPRPFDLAELYAHIGRAFEGLHIPNLRLGRKLFVSGRAIRREAMFLPDIHHRPVQAVDDQVVAGYASSPSKSVRHYLCVETVDWNGELAITLFIRFQKLSSKLFVELSAFLLPPLKPSYYSLDKVHPNLRFKDALAILAVAVVKSAFLLVLAPLISLTRLQTAFEHGSIERRQRKQIDEDLLFDYGAGQSVREMATGRDWRFYFQKLDKEMHHKILQQQLLDSLVDFLDDHGVDTSEIKERTMHILNNGVIVSGGALNAQGLAVGEGAQAKVSNAIKRTRQKMSA